MFLSSVPQLRCFLQTAQFRQVFQVPSVELYSGAGTLDSGATGEAAALRMVKVQGRDALGGLGWLGWSLEYPWLWSGISLAGVWNIVGCFLEYPWLEPWFPLLESGISVVGVWNILDWSLEYLWLESGTSKGEVSNILGWNLEYPRLESGISLP